MRLRTLALSSIATMVLTQAAAWAQAIEFTCSLGAANPCAGLIDTLAQITAQAASRSTTTGAVQRERSL